MSFVDELKRRRVFRTALGYLAAAWLLIQVLETLFPIFGLPETSIRIVVLILAIGLLPVVTVAWIFQWTPAGLRRDADLSEAEAAAASSRKIDRVVIGLLTLAVVYFSVDRFVLRSFDDAASLDRAETIARDYLREHPSNDKSIAVLPFRSLDTDERTRHFAAGLSEQVRVTLGSAGGLRVISRSSVAPYENFDRPVSQLGEILGAARILTGSVRRSSDRVRLNAELIDTASGELLWTESFDAELSLTNVLDIQDGLADSVADALQIAAAAKPVSGQDEGPRSLAALDAYHDGLFFLNTLIQDANRSDEEVWKLVERATVSLEEAINADPEWAPPRAMLGRLLHFRWNFSGNPADLATSKRHVLDALRLDEELGPAHASHAYLLAIDGQYEAAATEAERSISLGYVDAYWSLGIIYRYMGRHEDAIGAFLQAVSVDPLVLPIRLQLAQSYYCAGDYRRFVDDLRKYFPPGEDQIKARLLLADALARLGEHEEALSLAGEIALRTNEDSFLASVYYFTGDVDRAREAVAEFDEPGPFVALDIVPGLLLLGERDRALDLLERAFLTVTTELSRREQNDWLWALRCPTEIQGLRGNARFDAILAWFGSRDR